MTDAGKNALSIATRNNHDALGRVLIKEELEVSSRRIHSQGVGFQYKKGKTSLHLVVVEGNIELVSALLVARWDLDSGSCPHTPVLDAIYHNHDHVARLLIEKGSRIDDNLLLAAAGHALTDTIRILLSKGANANAVCYWETPLELAATKIRNPKKRLETIELLINNGARVDVNVRKGIPLVLETSKSELEDVTKLLIESGAPLDETGVDRAAVVHFAARQGDLQVICALIARGTRLDMQQADGRTALYMASEAGHVEVVKALLEANSGEWIDLKDRHLKTALYNAVSENNVELARALVEYGADMTCRMAPGLPKSTPLANAIHQRYADMVQLFIDMGVTPDEKFHGDIVRDAIAGRDIPTIRALLSKDSKIPLTGKRSYASEVLPYAIGLNSPPVLELLLELLADISDVEALKTAIH